MEGGLDKAIQKQRIRDAVDFHDQQENLDTTAQAAPEGVPRPETPQGPEKVLVKPGRLKYAALDQGLVFLNPDGTEYKPTSPEEEVELQMAAAAHMATGQQTSGAPEMELQMLTPEGKLPNATEPTPTPGAEQAPAPASGESTPPTSEPAPLSPIPESQPTKGPDPFEALAISDDSGGVDLKNLQYRKVMSDRTYEKNPDGSEKFYSQEEVDRQRAAAGGGGNSPPETPSSANGADREPQNVGKIAVEVPGQYVSWRERNKDALLYDGIPLKNTREILANPREAQLFGEMLQVVGGEQKDEVLARFERYKNGSATKDDRDFVTYATKEFSRSLKFAEDAVAQIKQEDIELFSRSNSDIENMYVQEGQNRAGELIKNSIFHMSMRNPEGVASLVGELRRQKENQASPLFQKWNKEVNEVAKATGIQDVKNFDAMFDMRSGERAATRERVRGQVREEMNIFEKALDMTAGRFGLSKTDRLMKRADWIVRMKQKNFFAPTSWSVSNVDQALGGITTFLGETVGNDEIRSLVAKEVIENRNYALASERGPRSFAEMQRAASEQTIRSTLEQNIRNDPQWSTGGEAYQNGKLGEWKNEEARKQAGTGFWAWLFSFAFGKEFNKAATAVARRPVHV